MKLVEELDSGPVYAGKEISILSEDDRGSLEAKLAGLGSELLISVLDGMGEAPSPRKGEGGSGPLPQTQGGITYCAKLTAGDERLRWTETSQSCWNRVRAFAPAPGAHFSLPGGEICKVLKAQIYSPLPNPPPGKGGGTVGEVKGPGPDKGLLVACGGGGVLNLLQVRPAGKKDQNGSDLLNGKKVRVGDILPS